MENIGTMSEGENEERSKAPENNTVLHRIEFTFDDAYIRKIAWHAAARRYGRFGIPALVVIGVIFLGLSVVAAQHRVSTGIVSLLLGIWLPMLPMFYYWQMVRYIRKFSKKSLNEKLSIEFIEDEIRVNSPLMDSRISHEALLDLELGGELVVFGMDESPFCVPRAAVDEDTLNHLLGVMKARNRPVKRKD